jgi:hypothetical protein
MKDAHWTWTREGHSWHLQGFAASTRSGVVLHLVRQGEVKNQDASGLGAIEPNVTRIVA